MAKSVKSEIVSAEVAEVAEVAAPETTVLEAPKASRFGGLIAAFTSAEKAAKPVKASASASVVATFVIPATSGKPSVNYLVLKPTELSANVLSDIVGCPVEVVSHKVAHGFAPRDWSTSMKGQLDRAAKWCHDNALPGNTAAAQVRRFADGTQTTHHALVAQLSSLGVADPVNIGTIVMATADGIDGVDLATVREYITARGGYELTTRA
jgi:hypothetical protein